MSAVRRSFWAAAGPHFCVSVAMAAFVSASLRSASAKSARNVAKRIGEEEEG